MLKILLFVFLLFSRVYSQGLIINEVSNGVDGTKEFIELLVIGSSSQPTGVVDISGWVIDDNNGDFETLSGTGVAAGHYRFVSYPPVKIGSLIVIYNHDDVNGNVPTDDELDSNNDFVYVLPINSTYLERCTSLPSSTNGSLYSPCTYSSLPTQTWLSTGFRNGGDAVQVRKQDYSFYHGFSYGDVLAPYPTFPNGNTSFNVRTGSGTTRNYFLDCGDWTLQTSYQRGDANFDTPGATNTTDNNTLVLRIRNGMFNYNNLGDLVNCQAILLDVNKLDFGVDKVSGGVFLHWNYLSSLKYEIQRSTNGYEFSFLAYSDSSYFDYEIYDDTYYRLKITSDDVEYSNTVFVEYESEYDLYVYPNPFNESINIESIFEFKYIIYDMYGVVIQYGIENTIDTYKLPIGVYILNIQIKDYNIFKKISKY
jgi:hypothetical protein